MSMGGSVGNSMDFDQRMRLIGYFFFYAYVPQPNNPGLRLTRLSSPGTIKYIPLLNVSLPLTFHFR